MSTHYQVLEATPRLEQRVDPVTITDRSLLAKIRTFTGSKAGYAVSRIALLGTLYLAGCDGPECEKDSDCDSWEQCVESCETYEHCGEPAQRCKNVCAPKDAKKLDALTLTGSQQDSYLVEHCGDSQ